MAHSGSAARPGATRTHAKPVIREHRIPTPDSKPYIAVEGPDGNLWFCENGASKIGCFDPRTGAVSRIRAALRRQLAGRHRWPAPMAIFGLPRRPATVLGASARPAQSRSTHFRLPSPVRMASRSDPMAISGSPRATPIASHALRLTAASPNSAPVLRRAAGRFPLSCATERCGSVKPASAGSAA